MQTAFELHAQESDFIIVNKRQGINIHDEDSEEGLVTILRSELDDHQLFPVHRLDKDTSGLIIVAKGQEANSRLSQMFQRRQINKFYWAISDRKSSKKQGSVIGDMTKARNGSWKLTRGRENPAVTQFFSYGLGNGKRAYLLRILTGKTHQIRVALKSLGAPVLGDKRYGGRESDRLYLHADSLIFQYAGNEYCYRQAPSEGEFFIDESFQEKYQSVGHCIDQDWPADPSS